MLENIIGILYYIPVIVFMGGWVYLMWVITKEFLLEPDETHGDIPVVPMDVIYDFGYTDITPVKKEKKEEYIFIPLD